MKSKIQLKTESKRNYFPKWLKLSLLFFFDIIVLILGRISLASHQNKFYHGIQSPDFFGRTNTEQAQTILNGNFKNLSDGFLFSYSEPK